LRTITRIRGEKIPAGIVGTPNHFLREDGSAWELTEQIFEDDIATQTGFSRKSWDLLVKEHGQELAVKIATNSIVEPPIIVTCPPRSSMPTSVIPHSIQGFGVVPPSVEIANIFALHSDIRVQDPTSAKALSLAASLEPLRILDLCAGRGTKTKQLRSMFPDAFIGATEPNDMRRTSLLEIADEYNIDVYIPNSSGPSEPFDLILVDVPCSNSGVFARRPEAKYRYNSKSINSVVELQQSILKEAMAVLQPRGHLLYATCSVERVENESQTNWLIMKQKLALRNDVQTLPSGQPNSDPTKWHDGGYCSLLQAT
jgi:16S rRNA (cytosine967-C5)-methyltransferase